MSAIFTVAGKLVTLFIYVIVGYAVSKRKMIGEAFSNGISRFLLVVTLPCLVLTTFEADYTPDRLMKAGEVYLIHWTRHAGDRLLCDFCRGIWQ